MGVVWRAHDELLHRDVAIKQLLLPGLAADEVDEACRRAMREARIAARLQHPNAVGVFDVVVEDGKPCLVMEFVPSRSLSAVLAERGALPPAEAARIGGHVAAALAAAHRAGVVHRDIKPGNVLIGVDGTVKITDFGISRAVGDVAVTRTGMLAGTLAYLAPELACGADPTPAADVFSLGATLYAVVEGGPPFGSSDNDLGMLHRIAGGRIVPPTRSGPLTVVLTRLLANDPATRPTAEQASRELAALATPTFAASTTAPPITPPPGVPRPTALPPTTAAPTTAPTATTDDYPTAEAPTSDETTTEAPPETTAPTTPDAAPIADYVRDHFANLPHDPATARENWAPENRPSEWEDDQFWGSYSDVTPSGEPEVSANGATYTAHVTLEFTPQGDDEPFTEDYRLIIVLRDDRLLIVDLAQA
nr:serine/threonine-protein kinase [Saccharothrix sp. CB00851]